MSGLEISDTMLKIMDRYVSHSIEKGWKFVKFVNLKNAISKTSVHTFVKLIRDFLCSGPKCVHQHFSKGYGRKN